MNSKGPSGPPREVSPRVQHGHSVSGRNSIQQTPSGGDKKLPEKINNQVSLLSQPSFSPEDDNNNGISCVASPPDMQGERGKNGVHSHRREEGQQQQNKNKVTNPNKTKKKTSNQKNITIPPRPPPSDGIAQLQWQGNYKSKKEESMFGMWSDKEKPDDWGEATYESKDTTASIGESESNNNKKIVVANPYAKKEAPPKKESSNSGKPKMGITALEILQRQKEDAAKNGNDRDNNDFIGSNNRSSISSGVGDIGGIGGFGGLGIESERYGQHPCDEGTCDPNVVAGVNGGDGGYGRMETKSSSNQTKPKRGGNKNNKRKSPLVHSANQQLAPRVEGDNLLQFKTVSSQYSRPTDKATKYIGDNKSLTQICQRSTTEKKNTRKEEEVKTEDLQRILDMLGSANVNYNQAALKLICERSPFGKKCSNPAATRPVVPDPDPKKQRVDQFLNDTCLQCAEFYAMQCNEIFLKRASRCGCGREEHGAGSYPRDCSACSSAKIKRNSDNYSAAKKDKVKAYKKEWYKANKDKISDAKNEKLNAGKKCPCCGGEYDKEHWGKGKRFCSRGSPFPCYQRCKYKGGTSGKPCQNKARTYSGGNKFKPFCSDHNKLYDNMSNNERKENFFQSAKKG